MATESIYKGPLQKDQPAPADQPQIITRLKEASQLNTPFFDFSKPSSAIGNTIIDKDGNEVKPKSIFMFKEEIGNIVLKLNTIRQGLEDLQKNKAGHKPNAPAASCGEIRMIYDDAIKLGLQVETLKNGSYWIDPNQGYYGDSFQVECRFYENSTTNCFDLDYSLLGIINREILENYTLSQFNFLLWRALQVEQELVLSCNNSTQILKIDSNSLPSLKFEAFSGDYIHLNEIDLFLNQCHEYGPPKNILDVDNEDLELEEMEDYQPAYVSQDNENEKKIGIRIKTNKSRRLPVKKFSIQLDQFLADRKLSDQIYSRICFIEEYLALNMTNISEEEINLNVDAND